MPPGFGGYLDLMTNTDSSAPSADTATVEGPEIHPRDVVAWAGQVEDQARRVLASGGPDAETATAIEGALAQLEADRANGESPQASAMRLQQVLDRDELRRG